MYDASGTRISRTTTRSPDVSPRSKSQTYARSQRGISGSQRSASLVNERSPSASNHGDNQNNQKATFSLCQAQLSSNVFGPTADETIMVGLKTFMSICKCPDQSSEPARTQPPADQRNSAARIPEEGSNRTMEPSDPRLASHDLEQDEPFAEETEISRISQSQAEPMDPSSLAFRLPRSVSEMAAHEPSQMKPGPSVLKSGDSSYFGGQNDETFSSSRRDGFPGPLPPGSHLGIRGDPSNMMRMGSVRPGDPSMHDPSMRSHMSREPTRASVRQSSCDNGSQTSSEDSSDSGCPSAQLKSTSFCPSAVRATSTPYPSRISGNSPYMQPQQQSHMNSSYIGQPSHMSQMQPQQPSHMSSSYIGQPSHMSQMQPQQPSHMNPSYIGQQPTSIGQPSHMSQMQPQHSLETQNEAYVSSQLPTIEDIDGCNSQVTALKIADALAGSTDGQSAGTKHTSYPAKSQASAYKSSLRINPSPQLAVYSSTMTDEPSLQNSSTTTTDDLSRTWSKDASSETCSCCSCGDPQARRKKSVCNCCTNISSKRRRRSSERLSNCDSCGKGKSSRSSSRTKCRKRSLSHKKSGSSSSSLRSERSCRVSKKKAAKTCDCTTSTTTTTDADSECGNANEAGDGTCCDVRYAICKITKFCNYTTFEVMKSTRKKPKIMPKTLEGVFVLKNKDNMESKECVKTVVLGCR